MNRLLPTLLFSTFLFLFSCENNPSHEPEILLGDPVETNPPNTNYQPAFEGQTRIGSVKTTTDLNIEILNENLGRPWGIVSLPDQRLLITEKSGIMNLFSANGDFISKIENFPAVDDRGQGGLLDVALDPNFNQNRMIYWTFSEPYQNGNLTSVGKGKLSTDEKLIENPQIIYRAIPSYDGTLHYGGRLVFDKNGYLYISTGERSDKEPRMLAQDLKTGLGKIIRINSDGSAVSQNPFINTPNALPEVYTFGHRNVQGLAFHPESVDLWQTEFGAKGGDEINRIEAGKNYGWPIISYGLEYNGEPIGDGLTQYDGMEQPTYYWDPSISPSGIDFYSGTEIEEWKNNLFIGALSGMHIIRIVIKDQKVVGEERLLADRNERFRDILGSHPSGALYAITDSGKLIRISKK